MNDVKITDRENGWMRVQTAYSDVEYAAAEVAALRAHFAAERVLTQKPHIVAAIREAAHTHKIELDAAEQPATPTPSTEQIAGALDEYRSRLEEEDPAIQRLNETDPYVVASIFNQGYQAALVSPVSEQPTPLDLEPDRDPITGSMVPCVICGMSPQVGGTGFCSPECQHALDVMLLAQSLWEAAESGSERESYSWDSLREQVAAGHRGRAEIYADLHRQAEYLLNHGITIHP